MNKSECCVSDCNFPKNDDGSILHRFPADRETRSIWMMVVGNFAEEGSLENRDVMICSNHFLSDCYKTDGSEELKPNAVPSLFDYAKSINPKACRMCLKYDKRTIYYSIFAMVADVNLVNIIFDLFDIEVKEDDEFSNICEKCLAKIDIAECIKREFSEANKKLSDYISRRDDQEPKIKTEDEPPEIMYIEMSPKMLELNDDDYIEIEPVSKSMTKNKIKCYLCTKPKPFNSKYYLKTHLSQHVAQLSCETCAFQTDNVELVNNHLAEHDRRETYEYTLELKNYNFKCYLCNSVHESENHLKDHLETHLDFLPFSCKFCENVKVSTMNGANKHMKLHDEVERPFKCAYCEIRFKYAPVKSDHENNIHLKKMTNKIPTKIHQCTYCGKTFNKYSTFIDHEAIHNQIKKYFCNKCDRKFTSRSNCTRHQRLHTPYRPFKCTNCPAQFNQKGQLEMHHAVRHIDSSNKTLQCSYCKKFYASKILLTRHIKFIHSITRKIPSAAGKIAVTATKTTTKTNVEKESITRFDLNQCQFCGVSFMYHPGLIEHLEKEHSEEEFEFIFCEQCGAKFMNNYRLTFHMKYHHNREYKCQICDKTFKSKGGLDEHLTVHSKIARFACDLCDTKLKTKKNLIRHQKIHLDIRNFPCDICGRAFRARIQMQTHRRGVHTKEKPFPCPYPNCEQMFGDRGLLSKHKKKHLNEMK